MVSSGTTTDTAHPVSQVCAVHLDPAGRDSGVVGVQAQRHALVSISKVLRSAHRETLSPVLQSGRTIALAASVLYHTANSDVSNQQQWQAWCCRVLWDATEVDQACCSKVRPPASPASRAPSAGGSPELLPGPLGVTVVVVVWHHRPVRVSRATRSGTPVLICSTNGADTWTACAFPAGLWGAGTDAGACLCRCSAFCTRSRTCWAS